jgi:hypothetical protein
MSHTLCFSVISCETFSLISLLSILLPFCFHSTFQLLPPPTPLVVVLYLFQFSQLKTSFRTEMMSDSMDTGSRPPRKVLLACWRFRLDLIIAFYLLKFLSVLFLAGGLHNCWRSPHTVIFGSNSCNIHDHILLSNDFRNCITASTLEKSLLFMYGSYLFSLLEIWVSFQTG